VNPKQVQVSRQNGTVKGSGMVWAEGVGNALGHSKGRHMCSEVVKAEGGAPGGRMHMVEHGMVAQVKNSHSGILQTGMAEQ